MSQKLKDAIRRTTKRTNGHSLQAVINRFNPTLRGWYA
ncbi:MAG: group II intron maturase-specific domain-containing protein [Planctomycetaceae bacterium]